MCHSSLRVAALSMAFFIPGTVISGSVAAAQQLDQLANLIDSQFKSFAENLSAAQSHKALKNSSNSGATALNFGFELSTTQLERNSFLEEYTAKETPDTLYIPKFLVNTGQGVGWNASAFYSSVPESEIEIYGTELRYTLATDHRYLPELLVRGTYSQLTGYEDMLVTSTGVELSISKGFAGFTPYAGIGTTRIDGEYELDGYTSRLTHNKYFMGLQFNLGLISLSAETEQTGETATTRAKMGIHF
jgi:hypothetical protein